MIRMKTFSADTLREARGKLLARSVVLRERVQRVRADLARANEPLPGDAPDAAIVRENDQVLEAVEASASGEISLIKSALARLEAGSFGVCDRCRGEIEPARLEAIPYATQCKTCARDP